MGHCFLNGSIIEWTNNITNHRSELFRIDLNFLITVRLFSMALFTRTCRSADSRRISSLRGSFASLLPRPIDWQLGMCFSSWPCRLAPTLKLLCGSLWAGCSLNCDLLESFCIICDLLLRWWQWLLSFVGDSIESYLGNCPSLLLLAWGREGDCSTWLRLCPRGSGSSSSSSLSSTSMNSCMIFQFSLSMLMFTYWQYWASAFSLLLGYCYRFVGGEIEKSWVCRLATVLWARTLTATGPLTTLSRSESQVLARGGEVWMQGRKRVVISRMQLDLSFSRLALGRRSKLTPRKYLARQFWSMPMLRSWNWVLTKLLARKEENLMSWSRKFSMNWSLMFEIQVSSLIGTQSNRKWMLSSSSSTDSTSIMCSFFNLRRTAIFSMNLPRSCRPTWQTWRTSTLALSSATSSHQPKGQLSSITTMMSLGIGRTLYLQMQIMQQNRTAANHQAQGQRRTGEQKLWRIIIVKNNYINVNQLSLALKAIFMLRPYSNQLLDKHQGFYFALLALALARSRTKVGTLRCRRGSFSLVELKAAVRMQVALEDVVRLIP